jgi:hypothetical protein
MKKSARSKFRDDCFERDNFCCRMCGFMPNPFAWESYKWAGSHAPLDAHHICDRQLMPFGGYVKENGISLCDKCHLKAEQFHATGVAHPGYSPSSLYSKIGSNYNLAVQQSFSQLCENGHELYTRLEAMKMTEEWLLLALHEPEVSPSSWELACEEVKETDPNILLYGKGRNFQ